MGIFDFFSGGKGGKATTAIGRVAARANNKDAQSIDRWKALEQLRDDGSEEAVAGLLRRFSFNYDKSIEDEQEKQWVHDTLVEMANGEGHDDGDGAPAGEHRAAVLAALEKALVGADSIAWLLKVLEHVAPDPDEAWPILEKVIAANDNDYVRDPSRKIQLIHFLGEHHDPRVARSLVQYLDDVDEGVRFQTVEAMLHQKDEETLREPLLALLVKKEEDSRRIKIRILDGLVDLGWTTHGHKGEVDALCAEIGRGYSVDNKGRVRRAGK